MTKILQRFNYTTPRYDMVGEVKIKIVIFSDGSVRWSDLRGNLVYGKLTIRIESLPINPADHAWPIRWGTSIDLNGNIAS